MKSLAPPATEERLWSLWPLSYQDVTHAGGTRRVAACQSDEPARSVPGKFRIRKIESSPAPFSKGGQENDGIREFVTEVGDAGGGFRLKESLWVVWFVVFSRLGRCYFNLILTASSRSRFA